MHYICNQSEMLTTEGLSLLLLKTNSASAALTTGANGEYSDMSEQTIAEDFDLS